MYIYIYRKRLYQKTFAGNTTCLSNSILHCKPNDWAPKPLQWRIGYAVSNIESVLQCLGMYDFPNEMFFQVRRCNTYTYLNTHEHAQTTPHNRKPTKSNSRGGRSLTNIKGNPCYMIGLTPVIKTCDKPSAPLSASPTSPEPISRF